MLKPTTIATVKATAPVLAEHGYAIIQRFYERLFQAHPELKNLFNMRHQERGEQQRALAGAVLAYATHIDNLPALAPAVARITHKHASLNVQPEQYGVVGQHLLAAIKEVLGDAATTDIIDAWAEAYQVLADIMIKAEARLYEEAAARPGGWRGWRNFVVSHKRPESDVITSFFLEPEDGKPIADFKPGQYISVVVDVPGSACSRCASTACRTPRTASRYRISVKRESEGEQTGRLRLEPAARPREHGRRRQDRAALRRLPRRHGGHHASRSDQRRRRPDTAGQHAEGGVEEHRSGGRLRARRAQQQRARDEGAAEGGCRHEPAPDEHRLLRRSARDDVPGYDYDHVGMVDLRRISRAVLKPDADYYICGPLPFMRKQVAVLKEMGVDEARLHYEVFGTDVFEE